MWRTGKPGMLQSMGSQRVRQDWVTEQQHWATVEMQEMKHLPTILQILLWLCEMDMNGWEESHPCWVMGLLCKSLKMIFNAFGLNVWEAGSQELQHTLWWLVPSFISELSQTSEFESSDVSFPFSSPPPPFPASSILISAADTPSDGDVRFGGGEGVWRSPWAVSTLFYFTHISSWLCSFRQN